MARKRESRWKGKRWRDLCPRAFGCEPLGSRRKSESLYQKKSQAFNHPAVGSPRGSTVRHHGGRLKTLTEEGLGPASTSVTSESKRSKNTADKEEVGAARRWLVRCLLPLAPAARYESWPGCCSHGVFTLAALPARNVPPSLDSRPPRTPLLEGLLESLL